MTKIDEIKAPTRNSIVIGPFGSRMKSDCYTEVGVPVIRGTNLTGGRTFSGNWVYVSEETANALSNCNAFAGDLVFPHRGAIGEVGIVPSDYPRYMLSSSLMKLTCDTAKADALYLYYFFKSDQGKHQLLKNASQVGTPGIGQPLSSLKGIDLFLPSLEYQKAAVRLLGSLDDKIELNRQINQTLEQMAQALFQAWFVDFEPVKAKVAALAEGRDPLRAAMSTLSGKTDAELDELPGAAFDTLAATAALFPEEMEESALGEIPKGWVVSTLADFCNLNAKSWGSTSLPEQIYYIDLANAKNGIITEVQAFSAKAAPSRARRVLRPGDTILGTVRPGNKSFALIGNMTPPLTGSTGFAVLSPRHKSQRELVYLTATSEQNIARLTRLADGAAYPAVRPDVVANEVTINPGEKLIEAFHTIVGPLFDAILMNLSFSGTLATLRDSLLPRLLSGELAVTPEEAEGLAGNGRMRPPRPKSGEPDRLGNLFGDFSGSPRIGG